MKTRHCPPPLRAEQKTKNKTSLRYLEFKMVINLIKTIWAMPQKKRKKNPWGKSHFGALLAKTYKVLHMGGEGGGGGSQGLALYFQYFFTKTVRFSMATKTGLKPP